MKWSKYNYIVNNRDGNYLLYNGFTESLSLIAKEIKQLLDTHRQSIDDIQRIHPDLYAFLVKKEFVVDDALNESERVVKTFEQMEEQDDKFQLIINPTLDCNLRCWYCYEKHSKETAMPDNTMQAIKELIRNLTEKPNIRHLNLSFFGGEPLLGFRDRVRPLVEYADKQCSETGKTLNFAFTTNGVLLTRQATDFLTSFGRHLFLQIPFDGSRDLHNSIKKFSNGRGTYDRTLENIRYALGKGAQVSVRCNYTDNNAESFKELIRSFESIPEEEKKQLSFSFHRVWQTSARQNTERVIRKTERLATKLGIRHTSNHLSKMRCYADSKNSIVVNWNGDIYKCTARDFLPELKEGDLHPDGTITYNERYQDRMEMRHTNKACLACNIFPLCSSCTQDQLELFDADTCPRHHSGAEKRAMIIERILAISTGTLIDHA